MDSDDEYIVDDFSDEGGVDSSDDDELVMKEFVKQSMKGKQISVKEFEAEMKAEFELRAVAHQNSQGFQIPKAVETDGANFASTSDRDKYFDTDSEEENEEEDPTTKVNTNMELLYDPDMDAKDEAWVQKQRGKYQMNLKKPSKQKLVANSDAVLNCPACFTTLCHDCQRHETYKTQYRAMFTVNCSVDKTRVMKAPQPTKKGRSKKAALAEPSTTQDEKVEETYHPVRCSACDTHVAMFDCDEVYHFFNVVTSH